MPVRTHVCLETDHEADAPAVRRAGGRVRCSVAASLCACCKVDALGEMQGGPSAV